MGVEILVFWGDFIYLILFSTYFEHTKFLAHSYSVQEPTHLFIFSLVILKYNEYCVQCYVHLNSYTVFWQLSFFLIEALRGS